MKIILRDLNETMEMGRILGSHAEEGTVFAVIGDLGAGKTSLAQGVAIGLGVHESSYVNSPTFTLHQRHSGRTRFHHVDLYRLNSTEELVNLGLRELVGVDGVSYIEWPSRAPDLIPSEAVWIRLEFFEDGRAISFGHSHPDALHFIERVCNLARQSLSMSPV